jgi:hypothetical protein
MENILNLVILQLIAHLITDFYSQNDEICKRKKDRGFKTGYLYGHALLTFLIAWLFSSSLNFVVYALVIGVAHLLIDGIKSILRNWKYIFFADQIAHIAIIVTAVCFYNQKVGISLPVWLTYTRYLLLISGVIFCLKPTNVLISNILETFKINSTDDTKETGELEKAGRLIGNLERILALVLVLLCQYQATGFLIAAKAILRFKDTSTAKTEYVLIGTLLSFGVAILIGVFILKFKTFVQ